MTNPPLSVQLADDIAHQLGKLTHLLSQSPAHEAAQLLVKVLDHDEGVLGRVTELVATGSRFAQEHSQRGILHPEVWLALGRAANELDSVSEDLNEYTGTIKQLATPATRAASPAARPTGSAMVVRRHR
ncbi:hypothetical protein [Streptomyces pseudovenezuelae]|uniref:hypothetical protein n=1 Tax=Streptomyces pseudovenezuelae TaxID=67350 RepID=UPI002E811860|nr:hypothetical protein [Streptomyces pseudovenezuelae]WUA87598.1 hypothetical protein OHO81_10005 [Streptomyces pseudovenezuelae]